MGSFNFPDFSQFLNKKNSDVEAWIQFDNDEPIMIMDNINDDVTITLPISKDLGESYIEFKDNKGKEFKLFLKNK